MKNNIQEILEELYKIDSSLQTKEEDLKKAVAHLLEIKPNITVDETFKNELQNEIQQKILQKKIESFWKNKLSIFQIFSYIFGTLGLACFGFIILRENVQLSSKPIQIPLVTQKEEEKNTESLSASVAESSVWENALMSNISPDDFKTKSREITPAVGWDKEEKMTKKIMPPVETITTESVWVSSDSSLPDSAWATADMSMMADAAPPQESMWLMKSSPMMAEYIQDVYVYSFTWEINLDFKTSYPTFKKLSPNNTYFSEEKLILENKVENILQVALKWGKDWLLEMPQSEKKREVHVVLQNPKIVYTNIYNFVWGTSIEYFAPSVVFEVKSSDDPNFYQTEIVVPLVKEIYKYDENGNIVWLNQ